MVARLRATAYGPLERHLVAAAEFAAPAPGKSIAGRMTTLERARMVSSDSP